MKKLTTRKLMMGRETVKTLLTGVPGRRLRDVQGGSEVPETAPEDPENSRKWDCTDSCHTSVKPT